MSSDHFIRGKMFIGTGPTFSALDPATGEETWTGTSAAEEQVQKAVDAARYAQELWADLAIDDRVRYLHLFGEQVRKQRDWLSEWICRSTGKPKWESGSEVDAVVGKTQLTIEAHRARRQDFSSIPRARFPAALSRGDGRCRFFPAGLRLAPSPAADWRLRRLRFSRSRLRIVLAPAVKDCRAKGRRLSHSC